MQMSKIKGAAALVRGVFPALVAGRLGFRLCSDCRVPSQWGQSVSLLFLSIFSYEIFGFLFFDFVGLCL